MATMAQQVKAALLPAPASSDQMLRALADASGVLLACPDKESVCRHAVELARTQLGVERCALLLMGHSGENLVGMYGTDTRGETTDEHAFSMSLERLLQAFPRSLPLDERIWTAQKWAHCFWDQGYNQTVQIGEGWAACTPLFWAGELQGVLLNDTALSHAPMDITQQESLSLLCSLVSSALARLQAQSDSQQARAWVRSEIYAHVRNHTQSVAAMLDMAVMEDAEFVPPARLRGLYKHLRLMDFISHLFTSGDYVKGEVRRVSSRDLIYQAVRVSVTQATAARMQCSVEDVDIPAKQANSLIIVVYELVSRALHHSLGDVEARLCRAGGMVHLEVRQSDPDFRFDADSKADSLYNFQDMEDLSRFGLRAQFTVIDPPEGGAALRVSFPLD